jgi:hypothetical protein
MSEARRREAATRITSFRWRGAPADTTVDFADPRRCVDEAQWLNAAIPPNLPRNYPDLAWVSVHPAKFHNKIKTVGGYAELCFDHFVDALATADIEEFEAMAMERSRGDFSAIRRSAPGARWATPVFDSIDPLEE